MNPNLRTKTISGIKWSSVNTVTLALFGIIKISVLARVLEATDFGLMAIVGFVLGFIGLFMDMGLTTAILHKQEISNREYASLYWVNLFFSLVLFLLVCLVSSIIASFYSEPELAKVIPLSGLGLIFSALGLQFKTIEQKRLNFRYIAVVDILGATTGLLVGVFTAIKGWGVYSLVYAGLTQYALANLIYLAKGIYDRGVLFHFNAKEIKPFLKIGLFQVGSSVINFLNRDLDIIIIGKFFGSETLGAFSLAKKLVRNPLLIIDPIIEKVGVSVFPKFQSDHKKLRSLFLDLFDGLGTVNAIVYGTIAICAHWFVLFFYGADFLHIVLFVQLFTLVTYLRSMAGKVGMLVITTGRTDYGFYWNVFLTLVMPLAILVGSLHSPEMVIILLGFIQILLLIPGWYVFFYRLIKLPLVPFIKAHLYPLGISFSIFALSLYVVGGNQKLQFIFALLLLFVLFGYGYKRVEELRNLTKKLFKHARI